MEALSETLVAGVHFFDFFAEFVGGPVPAERVLVTINAPAMRQEMLARVRTAVINVQEGEMLLLRLDNVRLAPELAAPLGLSLFSSNQPEAKSTKNKPLMERLTKGRPTYLVNPDPGTVLVVHQVLDAENEMGLALFTDEEPWRVVYLGKMQNNLRLALHSVRDCPEAVTTEMLQKELGISRVDAAKRLGTLYHNGLLRRLAHERGFSYRFFHPYPIFHPVFSGPLPFARCVGLETWQAERFYEAALAAHERAHYFKAHALAKTALERWAEMDDAAGEALAHSAAGRAAVRISTYYLCKVDEVREPAPAGTAADTKRYEEAALRYHREAVGHLEKSLAYYRKCRDRFLAARTHHSLGLVFAEYQKKDHDKAKWHYNKSLAIRRRLSRDAGLDEEQKRDNTRRMVGTLNNLANLNNYNQSFPAAIGDLREAVALLRELGDRRGIAQLLLVYARQARLRDQWRRLVILTAAGETALRQVDFELPVNARNDIKSDREAAREALGMADYEQACEEGSTLSLDEAIYYADTMQLESPPFGTLYHSVSLLQHE